MTEQNYGAPASAYYSADYHGTHETPPRQKRWVTPVVSGLCGLLLGAGLAFGAVTYAAPPPKACQEALARADDFIGLSAEAIGIINQMFKASGAYNVTQLQSATADLNALRPRVDTVGIAYTAAKKECLG